MSEQLTPEEKMPRVGVGLLIIREYEILLGWRRGSHGAGEYGGPGGHLEFGETPEACIKRELAEEAGKNFVITNIAHLCTTNMLKYMPDKH